MITFIKKDHYRESVWKNGGGKTYEILISPIGSSLSKGDFDYRISSATIQCDGAFSTFSGYDRKLIVWKGEGLLINEVKLLENSPHSFAGEEAIYAKLIKDEVIDVGLIYKRSQYIADCKVIAKLPNLFEAGIHLLFIASGEIENATSGDTVLIEAQTSESFSFKTSEEILIYHFYLNDIEA
jgi:environmental stress-induced protein Ves